MTEALPAPYRNSATDEIYNLLFCDEPGLLASDAAWPQMATVLSETSAGADVRLIAEDPAVESRLRLLAFGWLRRHGLPVPKVFLGVVIEVHLTDGLDTLAAYVDGHARLIGRKGNMTFVEDSPESLREPMKGLLVSSEWVASQIGPWDKPRLPPPPAGSVRLTFLVSDGLHFGQGPFEVFARDKMAGPVLQFGAPLLQQMLDFSLKGDQAGAGGDQPA